MKKGDKAVFYRLQSKNYSIDSEHISFNCNFESLDEAMEADLIDRGVLPEIKLKEILSKRSLKSVWEEYTKIKSLYGWVEPGTSCFDSLEKLYNYFRDYIDDCNYNLDYILIFDGEFIDYGSEGEACVKFIKEIKRISLKELKKIIKE